MSQGRPQETAGDRGCGVCGVRGHKTKVWLILALSCIQKKQQKVVSGENSFRSVALIEDAPVLPLCSQTATLVMCFPISSVHLTQRDPEERQARTRTVAITSPSQPGRTFF